MDEYQISDEEYIEILIKADENKRWINDNYKRLSDKYSHQYVCVKDKKIICSSKSQDKVDHVHLELDVVCEYILPHGTAMLL